MSGENGGMNRHPAPLHCPSSAENHFRSEGLFLRKLLEAEPELPVLLLSQHLIPGYFVLLITGHPAQNAAQCSVHSLGDLVMGRARDDAVDECPLLVAIGELQVIEKRAVGVKLAGTRRCSL